MCDEIGRNAMECEEEINPFHLKTLTRHPVPKNDPTKIANRIAWVKKWHRYGLP